MASPTLKSWIDKLINSLGGKPLPAHSAIRADLVKIAHLAESLERGQSAVEAESKITALEAAVGELQSQIKYIESQRDDFKRLLDAASAEMQRIKKDQEEHEPLSTVESKILWHVDATGQTLLEELPETLGISKWVADRMLRALDDAGYLDFDQPDLDFAPFYFLTTKAKVWLSKNKRAGGDEVAVF